MKDSAESGFVLVAVLWFTALIALAAVAIEAWVSSALEQGAALDARIAAQAALITAEQRATFLLVTGTVSPRGIELGTRPARAPDEAASAGETEPPFSGPFVALDNRPYRVDRTIVRLQDGGGLYDINNPDNASLGRLLKSFGLTDRDREFLARSLIAYERKPNDINAGDDSNYLPSGLPPPRHAKLLTPWELLRIPGWRGNDRIWQPSGSLPEMLTLGPVSGLNVNTAPAQLLTAVGGVDQSEVSRLVAARAVQPIRTLRDLGTAAEPDNAQGVLKILPSNVIRLELTHPDEPLKRIIEVRLTPTGPAPIRTGYVVELPPQERSSDLYDAPALPEPPVPAGTELPR